MIQSCLKTRKKRTYGNKKKFFYINIHVKDRLDIQGGPKK